MSLLKSIIIIMRCDFKLESCFPGVMGYPGLAMVGNLGSDDGYFCLCSHPRLLVIYGIIWSCNL